MYMNNAILFFFDINAPEIKKINNNYYFDYLGENYVVYNYKRDLEEIMEIYYLNMELLNNGILGYEIFINKNNDILFMYEKEYYVLMKIPRIKNRVITYNDIVNFNYIPNMNVKKLDKSNWGFYWANKIDFIQYQFSQMSNKYKIIEESIDYFIGIWENGISYYNDNNIFSDKKYICHKRVTYDMDLLEFINPMNFVIDYKERDIGEYLKSYVLNNNYSKDILNKFLISRSRESAILLISRVLFPSYYFDLYEDIILLEKKEELINDAINKRNNVLYLVNFIFEKYKSLNITGIDWIKKEINLHRLI